MRILHIESNPIMLKIVREGLVQFASVVQATSQTEMQQALLAQEFDGAICGGSLVEPYDGFAIATLLKKKHGLRVVIFTRGVWETISDAFPTVDYDMVDNWQRLVYDLLKGI